MRAKFYLLILPCLVLSIVAHSQAEPEYIGQAITTDKVLLEKTKYEIGYGMNAGGVALAAYGLGKTKISFSVEGETSNTRVHATDTIRIIFNNGNQLMNPSELFSVVKFEVNVKKKNRFVITDKKGEEYKVSTTKSKVPAFFKKYGVNSYMIEIPGLTPGEYGIFSIASDSVLCFAVE